MTIAITNVGSDHLSWDIELPPRADAQDIAEAVYRSVIKKKALLSKGIDVNYDAETNSGIITVGVVRVVGTFRRVDAATATSGGN